MIQQSLSWAYLRENHNSKRYMHLDVQQSIIYNSQDVEAASTSTTYKWIRKMCCVYKNVGIYIYTHTYINICVCVFMHTHTHTHTKQNITQL